MRGWSNPSHTAAVSRKQKRGRSHRSITTRANYTAIREAKQSQPPVVKVVRFTKPELPPLVARPCPYDHSPDIVCPMCEGFED